MTLQNIIGRQNPLIIRRFTENGLYLGTSNANDSIEILLPRREVRDTMQIGDECTVFVYLDSEDRPVATLEKPLVQAGEVAYLSVIAVNRVGGFFDWGLPKDLLVPFSEQTSRLEIGRRYLIYVYIDTATNRIAGTMNLAKFVKNNELTVSEGDEVPIIIAEFRELGVRVVVNQRHWGMVYGNQVFQQLRLGQSMTGYIQKIRDDNKLDITLQPAGYDASIDTSVERVKAVLSRCGGFLPLTDRSDPEDVYSMLQMSKKQFKKAIGALYRDRLVIIEDNGIRSLLHPKGNQTT